MSRSPHTWRVERNAPLRSDAESVFVSMSTLPDASIGDRVEFVDAGGGVEHATGTIVDGIDDDGLPAFRVGLDLHPPDRSGVTL